MRVQATFAKIDAKKMQDPMAVRNDRKPERLDLYVVAVLTFVFAVMGALRLDYAGDGFRHLPPS